MAEPSLTNPWAMQPKRIDPVAGREYPAASLVCGGMASMSSRPRRALRELTSVLAAAAVALVTRSSFPNHYVVPTGSMLPTVQLQDHVLVSKLAYGVPLPLLPGYVA